MDVYLNNLNFRTCLCYLNDVLLYTGLFLKQLDVLNDRFRLTGLKLDPQKSECADAYFFGISYYMIVFAFQMTVLGLFTESQSKPNTINNYIV